MVKKTIWICVTVILLYMGFIQIQLLVTGRGGKSSSKDVAQQSNKNNQKVYSFSFSKYGTNGSKELEIEGDSANILTSDIILKNVIARTYAQETPITITADDGVFDKATNKVHLKNNVVATTDTGARLLTDELDIHPSSKKLETTLPAKVKRDNINVEGEGATGDSELKKVQFERNVTVVVQDPNSDANAPTIITCDGPLDIDYQANIAHFSDNVVARDKRGNLYADYMDVYYSEKSKKVYKVVASGNVVIKNKEGNTTYSDNAIYLAEEGRIILGGDVEAVAKKHKAEERTDPSSLDFFGWGNNTANNKKKSS